MIIKTPPAHSVLWDTRWQEGDGPFHSQRDPPSGRPQSMPAQLVCPPVCRWNQGHAKHLTDTCGSRGVGVYLTCPLSLHSAAGPRLLIGSRAFPEQVPGADPIKCLPAWKGTAAMSLWGGSSVCEAGLLHHSWFPLSAFTTVFSRSF